jgi:hypothetical protein
MKRLTPGKQIRRTVAGRYFRWRGGPAWDVVLATVDSAFSDNRSNEARNGERSAEPMSLASLRPTCRMPHGMNKCRTNNARQELWRVDSWGPILARVTRLSVVAPDYNNWRKLNHTNAKCAPMKVLDEYCVRVGLETAGNRIPDSPIVDGIPSAASESSHGGNGFSSRHAEMVASESSKGICMRYAYHPRTAPSIRLFILFFNLLRRGSDR